MVLCRRAKFTHVWISIVRSQSVRGSRIMNASRFPLTPSEVHAHSTLHYAHNNKGYSLSLTFEHFTYSYISFALIKESRMHKRPRRDNDCNHCLKGNSTCGHFNEQQLEQTKVLIIFAMQCNILFSQLMVPIQDLSRIQTRCFNMGLKGCYPFKWNLNQHSTTERRTIFWGLGRTRPFLK